MGRRLAFAYAVGCFLFGIAVCAYAAGFISDILFPHSINGGPTGLVVPALAGNAGLLVLFGLQHSGMARPNFKRWWTRLIPEAVERSTYVLASSVALGLVMAGWQPIPAVVWEVGAPGSWLLTGLAAGGLMLVAMASIQIDGSELLGLRQALLPDAKPVSFQTPRLYRLVRHPLMLGVLLALWAAPHMTVGRLEFNVGMTAYILAALRWEERDLQDRFGEAYADYRRRVPALIPWPGRRRAEAVVR